jgi:exopolysaccharide biosynthesis polyprenyl glycosylphosphotransferase
MRVEEASRLFEKLTGRIPIETIRPKALLFAKGFNKHNFLEIRVSRAFAIALSFLGLILCMPLLLVVALAIRIESEGPILFRQERVGRDGAVFNILKFRSMRMNAEKSNSPQWASINDPRVTRVGSIIRKLRIDEIPQLVNILRGDMNFVGPRPERPYFVDMLKDQIPYYNLRHSLLPGLTGWAQVCYPYGASIDDQKAKLEFDLFYLKNASFAFDIAILFETVRTVLLGKGR